MDAYDVLEKLGAGSFGTIHKIVRKADKKILCWKQIRYGRMNEKEKSMLVSEVNILRELKHVNIVRYKDRIIDRESSTIYIIMEYCENGDLSSVIRKHKRAGKRMEETKIWTLLFQMSCALHECHSRKQKILHRDIKPANVFIDKAQGFKLGDFGLARILGTETQFAKTNVGTPYYMAPEQVNEVPYNEKCDIWSLGCLIYEMAALAPPFEAANQLALAVKIKAGRVARLPQEYSEDLNHVVVQEQSETLARNALAVPTQHMDRYFSVQLRRLQSKEEELAQRSQDLAAKEKEARGSGGSGGSGGSANAADDARLQEQSKEVSRREEEVGRREDKIRASHKQGEDAERTLAERTRAGDARDKALAEREEALAERERAMSEKERSVSEKERTLSEKEGRVEKAKQEYGVLFNELKRRKRALDEATAKVMSHNLKSQNLNEATAKSAAAAAEPPSDAQLPGGIETLPDGEVARAGGGKENNPPQGHSPRKAFVQRSNSLRDDETLNVLRKAAGVERVSADNGVINRALSFKDCGEKRGAAPARSSKPEFRKGEEGEEGEARPRTGMLYDRERDQAANQANGEKGSAATAEERNSLLQRRLTADTKRQAIYGALFGKRPASGKALDEPEPEAITDRGAPVRLNNRRMVAEPMHEIDSSLDSPPRDRDIRVR
ncbi:kinase-like domain-containing protein [Baffinella frigidus]|nr:kinase-like domain-containing protein [Cryptophyta sp. CCMP2293]